MRGPGGKALTIVRACLDAGGQTPAILRGDDGAAGRVRYETANPRGKEFRNSRAGTGGADRSVSDLLAKSMKEI